MPNPSEYIAPDQLCIGLYVHLDLSWMDHPFTFNSFKIRSQKEIDTIRRLGLSLIRYEPDKCDSLPLPPRVVAVPEEAPPPAADTANDATIMKEKAARVEQLNRIRREIGAVEKKFHKAAESARNIRRNIEAQPQLAFLEAETLVGQMVTMLSTDEPVVIHAMSNKLGEGVYFHSLNVSVLSLMLARMLNINASGMRDIGLGALFHDFGKTDIPDAILLKTEPLTTSEQTFLERHCEYGLAIARKAGLTKPAQDIVMQHHEYMDGGGYPGKLAGDEITTLARLVTIVNTYDNLCNPVNPASALTPSETLAQMFALNRTKFDQEQLQAFIRCIGVYPPGSIVQLSNGMPGLVLSANPAMPLKPNVLLYDPEVPDEQAVIVNLGQVPDLRINHGLRPGQLPLSIHRYLNPRTRVTYFFDAPPQSDEQ